MPLKSEELYYNGKMIIRKIYAKIFVYLRRALKAICNYRIKAKYHFSHVTLASVGNAGDTVLSTALRDQFDLNYESISWRIKKVTSKITQGYIDSLNKTDAVIIGGHGLFMPDTNANDISNWEFACSEQQYDKITKPIIVYAVGYNYFKGQERSRLFESNIRKLVEKSVFFGLRNQGSVREIQSFLDDNLKEKVVYQPCPTMIARYLYPELPPKKVTGKVAFNVAIDRAKLRMGDNKDLILDQIAKAMQMICQKGYKVYFVTHMCTEIPFLRYIKKYNFDFTLCDVSTWDAKRLMTLYNEMDVVIGMRGHGIWIPFGVNCQIISLANQNKTKWFLEDINASDWYIDITNSPETLCDRIIEKFHEIHEVNGELTTKRLLEAQERLYNITQKNMQTIKSILEETKNDRSIYPRSRREQIHTAQKHQRNEWKTACLLDSKSRK